MVLTQKFQLYRKNMKKFAYEHEMTTEGYHHLYSVISGKRLQHKGWRLYKEEEE